MLLSNKSIINIAGPGTTGHRFYCKIPPANVGLNNSAVFSPVSNNIYCQGKKSSIDHSAVDIDADSLSYGFALPDAGGGPDRSQTIINWRQPFPTMEVLTTSLRFRFRTRCLV